MKIVGLTGGIGSGKSTVATMFRNLGIPVYNSDEEAKRLMHTSNNLKQGIIALLGKESYDNGELDRGYIAQRVFRDKNLLEALNALVHPEVRRHFMQWVQKQNSKYVIQEAAIIFENGSHERYDEIILVFSNVLSIPSDIIIKIFFTIIHFKINQKNKMTKIK